MGYDKMSHCFAISQFQMHALLSEALIATVVEPKDTDGKATRLELVTQIRQLDHLVKVGLLKDITQKLHDPKNKGRGVRVYLKTDLATKLFGDAANRPVN